MKNLEVLIGGEYEFWKICNMQNGEIGWHIGGAWERTWLASKETTTMLNVVTPKLQNFKVMHMSMGEEQVLSQQLCSFWETESFKIHMDPHMLQCYKSLRSQWSTESRKRGMKLGYDREKTMWKLHLAISGAWESCTRSRFSKEIKQLKYFKELSRQLKIITPSQFLDEEGLLHVGGRRHETNWSLMQKYPYDLPGWQAVWAEHCKCTLKVDAL